MFVHFLEGVTAKHADVVLDRQVLFQQGISGPND